MKPNSKFAHRLFISVLIITSSCGIYDGVISLMGVSYLASTPAFHYQQCLKRAGYESVFGTVVMKYKGKEMVEFRAYLTNRDRFKTRDLKACEKGAFSFAREKIPQGMQDIAKGFELPPEMVEAYANQFSYAQVKLGQFVKPMIFYDEQEMVTFDARALDLRITGDLSKMPSPAGIVRDKAMKGVKKTKKKRLKIW